MQLVGVFDTIKKVIQIIKIEWATGISPVAHYDYWELHIISLCSVFVTLITQFRELFGLGEQLYFFAILFSRSAIRVRKDNGSNTSM